MVNRPTDTHHRRQGAKFKFRHKILVGKHPVKRPLGRHIDFRVARKLAGQTRSVFFFRNVKYK
jgi:hypothetical protein